MSEIGLPPADAEIREVLLHFPQSVRIHLYTNIPQTSGPRVIGDYVEASWPGYEPWNTSEWTAAVDTPDGLSSEVDTRAEWRCTADIAPVVVRGMYFTITFQDGYVALMGETEFRAPVTIHKRGHGVLSPVKLTYSVVDVAT